MSSTGGIFGASDLQVLSMSIAWSCGWMFAGMGAARLCGGERGRERRERRENMHQMVVTCQSGV